MAPRLADQCRLKYCTARSCFSAAAREENVPRFFRFPVLGSSLREYKRYFPEDNFRIIVLRCPPPQRLFVEKWRRGVAKFQEFSRTAKFRRRSLRSKM
jgi:hypothetical protein